MESKTWRMIGTMSGTSGDGIDIAYCEFKKENNEWTYSLKAAVCEEYHYPDDYIIELRTAHSLPPNEFRKFDQRYAEINVRRIKEFIKEYNLENIDAIVSHGHTILHEPGIRSIQIGNGQIIANAIRLPVLCNLRSADVAKGGQGAPIVPIGDMHLFQEYRYCMNLGGIANVSEKTDGTIRAWDICGCNLLLNYFANLMDLEYDKGGSLARQGTSNPALLAKLMQWDYLKKPPPKSLEAMDVLNWLHDVSDLREIPLENALSTTVDFIVQAIHQDLVGRTKTSDKMLMTGGGAHNTYFMELLEQKLDLQVVIPEKEIIDFKEALVMAFFGVLHLRKETNCIPSVTGASEAVSGGELFLPQST